MRLLIEYIQQFGRFQRNARLYLISNALSGVTTGILLVLYNLYLVSLGYSADFIGFVLFVATIGAGIAIFPAGICVDRLGGKLILIWSSLLIGLAGIGQILFRQPVPLLVSAFVAGIGVAFALVVNAPFLTAHSTPAERTHLFSLNLFVTLVTTVLGQVIGGVLPLWFGSIPWLMGPLPAWIGPLLAHQPEPRSYQLSLLFAGVIAGPSFIPYFLMSNDRPQGRRDREQSRRAAPPQDRRETYPYYGRRRWLGGLVKVIHSPIFLLVLVQAFIGLGAGLFIPYFNLYFVQHLKSSTALFGLISGIATAITALFTMAAPWLATRLGKVNAITLTQLASIPLLLTIGLTPLVTLAAVLYLFRQGLMDMSMGVLQVFSMEAAPPQHRGLANSSYQAAFQVAFALSAPLGGLMITHIGYPPIFFGGALCYVLAIGTLWGNFGRTRGKHNSSSDAEQRETSLPLSPC